MSEGTNEGSSGGLNKVRAVAAVQSPASSPMRVPLLLIVGAMEILWAGVLLDLVGRYQSLAVPVGTLLLVLPVSILINVSLRHWRPSRGARLIPFAVGMALGVCGIAALWVALGQRAGQGEWPTILCGAGVLWCLGVRLGWRRPSFASVLREFQLGLVVFLATMFAAWLLQVPMATGPFLGAAFVVLGLLALGMARSGVYGFSAGRGRFLFILAVSVSTVLVTGIVVAALATPDVLQALRDGFAWVWRQIDGLLAAVGRWFPQDSGAAGAGPGLQAPGGAGGEFAAGDVLPESVLRVVRVAFDVFAMVMAILVIGSFMLRVVEWTRGRRLRASEAYVEPLGHTPGGGLWATLGRLHAYLVGEVRRLWRRRAVGVRSEAESVRELYRRMLRWAAKSGYARRPAQTPVEYARFLAAMCPEASPELEMITRAYDRVRYSRDAAGVAELEAVRQAWTRLRTCRLPRGKERVQLVAAPLRESRVVCEETT